MPKVVTANSLATGVVVFLAEDGSWTHEIAAARVFVDSNAAEGGLGFAKQDEARALVVDAFITDTGPETNGRLAMTLRDAIRAYGPTIDFMPADTAVRG